MDDERIRRLGQDRKAVAAAMERIAEAQEEADVEALRVALRQSVVTLAEVHADDELWARAGAIAEAGPAVVEADAARVADVAGALQQAMPRLLTYFGYETPPPPPPEHVARSTVVALGPALGGISADDAWEARADLGRTIQRITPLLLREGTFAVIPLAEAADDLTWWQEHIPGLAIGTGFDGLKTMLLDGAITGGEVGLTVAFGTAGIVLTALTVGTLKLWKRRKKAKADRPPLDPGLGIGLLDATQGAIAVHAAALDGRAASGPLDVDDAERHLTRLVVLSTAVAGLAPRLHSLTRQEALRHRHGLPTLLARMEGLRVEATACLGRLREGGPADRHLLAPVIEAATAVALVDLHRPDG